MTRPLVVGFLGRKGAGKTTAAQHLETTRGAVRLSFAAPLKVLAGLLYDLTPEQLYGDEKDVPLERLWNQTPRDLLCRLGAACLEVFGENFLVEQAIARILRDSEDDPEQTFVVDDVRLPREAAALAHDPRIRGYVVKLIWPDGQNDDRATERAVDEVEQKDIFCTVLNRRSGFLQEDVNDCMKVVDWIEEGKKAA